MFLIPIPLQFIGIASFRGVDLWFCSALSTVHSPTQVLIIMVLTPDDKVQVTGEQGTDR